MGKVRKEARSLVKKLAMWGDYWYFASQWLPCLPCFTAKDGRDDRAVL